jgi:hypothetical protein
MGDLDPHTQDPEPQSSASQESSLGIPLKCWAGFAVSLIAVSAAFSYYSIRVYSDW